MADLRADADFESYIQFLFQNQQPLDPVLQVEKGAANGVLKLDAAAHAILAQLASGTASATKYVKGDGSWSELDAAHVTSGTLDGDRLPAMSATKKGGVPATGTPTGLFLRDDASWAAVADVKVKSDAADPTADFLNGKVDGTTLEVDAVAHKMRIRDDGVSYSKIQNVSATDKILGRFSLLAGDIEEIDCTAAGRALLDDANATTQRSTLGLGDVAIRNVGTAAGTAAAGDDSRFVGGSSFAA